MMSDKKKRKNMESSPGPFRKKHFKPTKEEESRYLKDLEKKYNVRLPKGLPIVSIERIKFKSSHFSTEKGSFSASFVSDCASLYNVLGVVFNYLDVKDKYSALAACRFWNRAGNETSAWKNIQLKNCTVVDEQPLQRLILKHETEHLVFENVGSTSLSNDFCRFSSVQTLKSCDTSVQFAKLVLRACNQLSYFYTNTDDDSILDALQPYVKEIHIGNITLDQENNRFLKVFSDLETLSIKSIDPFCYKLISLFFSIRKLQVGQLCVNEDIQNFIECVPNVEYLEIAPVYSDLPEDEANHLLVDALKRCPSLKTIKWHVDRKEKPVQASPSPPKLEEQTNDHEAAADNEVKTNDVAENDTDAAAVGTPVNDADALTKNDESGAVSTAPESDAIAVEDEQPLILSNGDVTDIVPSLNRVHSETDTLKSIALKSFLRMSLPECDISVIVD